MSEYITVCDNCTEEVSDNIEHNCSCSSDEGYCDKCGLDSVLDCLCDLSAEEQKAFRQTQKDLQKEFLKRKAEWKMEYPWIQF